MRRIVFLLLLMASSLAVNARTSDVVLTDSLSEAPDDTTVTIRKHPWLAGLEIVGFNAGLVGFNRIFNKDMPFSHVTMRDIKRNISQRYWFWDWDGLEVNAFRHPVHGSLYYLMARANGMTVGESSLYTIGGSWMWEIFCEAEDPSISDMVYTAVGGITMGETLWRSGKCVYDLIAKGRQGLSVPFNTSLTVGFQHFEPKGDPVVRTAFVTWDATYGDLFDDEKRGPFDYFDLSGTFVLGRGQRIFNKARIDHQLWSHPVVDEPMKKVVMGLYHHYDYFCVTPYYELPRIQSDLYAYEYSEIGAIGPGIAYHMGGHTCWEQQLYVNGIMMGATSEHHFHDIPRGYSFGSGYGARLYSQLTVGSWLRMGLRAQCSHLFTWDGFREDNGWAPRDGFASIQGETGNTLTAIITPSLELQPLKQIALRCSGTFMHTHFNYVYHPHASMHAWEWQVGVKYCF